MPSTATQWLLDNQSAADRLDQMLIEAGLPLDILTEYPDWMKEKIADQLLESFNQPYWNDIAETFKGDAERYLRRGLDEGWSIRRIANSISEQLGNVALARATNIARTEAANALNGARRASMDSMIEELSPEFGGGDVPIRPVWLSVLGNTTRDTHADLDGVPADKDGMWELAGYRIPWPGHISLPPGERCHCQCTITVEFGLQDQEATRLIQEYGRRVERQGKSVEPQTKSTSYKPPEAARNNARRVLKWREEHGDDVEGMTPVGWRRASQLASGKEISLDIVKRMAQFNRHRDNYRKARSRQRQEGKPPWKYAGIVAWLGWGGSSGVNWAKRVSEGAKSVKRRDNHHVGPESTSNYWKLRQRIRSGKAKCYKCESKSNLVVHHMDGDVENDAMSNLRIVCDSCHRAAPDGPHAQSKHLPGQHNQMSHGRGGGGSSGGSVAPLTKGSLSPDAIDHWGHGWNRRIGERAILLVGDKDVWDRAAEGRQVEKDGKTQAVCAFCVKYNGFISEDGIELEYLASNMKGGGTKLVTEVCRVASERGMAVKLTSAKDAIGFYQKMGMEQIPLPANVEQVFMFTAEEAGRFYREHQSELKSTFNDLVELEPKDGVFVPGNHKKNDKREDRD